MSSSMMALSRLHCIAAHIAPSPCAAGAAGWEPLLSGQVAIVTGAGQGIGAATAQLFAKHGARVVVADLDQAKADAVVGEIRAAGGEAISFACDVTDPTFGDRVVQATIDAFGKLNIIVNNAGFTWDGMLHKMTDQQWHTMLDVHNTAPFRLIRAAAPYMREAAKRELDDGKQPENRSIVNISSTSGLHGNIGQANYSTAKMGIVGLTKTVAKEWGMFGIRCNAIAFGLINTRLTQAKEKGEVMRVGDAAIPLGIPERLTAGARGFDAIPLRRQGEPHEAASAVLFLASSLSSYVSGHTLEVTGGAGI